LSTVESICSASTTAMSGLHVDLAQDPEAASGELLAGAGHPLVERQIGGRTQCVAAANLGHGSSETCTTARSG
jgi:hypothetical protein